MSATERLTTAVFIAECVVKIVAKGGGRLEYFTDEDEGAFNCFDFSVVVIGLFYNITAMRLLRLFKIMVKVPSLRVLTLGLVAGIKACSAIMLLLSLIMFLFAIVGVQVFGANDPAHWQHGARDALALRVRDALGVVRGLLDQLLRLRRVRRGRVLRRRRRGGRAHRDRLRQLRRLRVRGAEQRAAGRDRRLLRELRSSPAS